MDYARKIINKLIDKFEASKSFIEANKVNQSFSFYIAKEFPEYKDETDFKAFEEINQAITLLCKQSLVKADLKKNNTYDKVVLDVLQIDNAYSFAKRKKKRDTNDRLTELLNIYLNKNDKILNAFAQKQIDNIAGNKKPQYFDDELNEYADILRCVYEIQRVEKETFLREFSIRLFGDSKKFEVIKDKVKNILFEYGSFAEKETIFAELNVLKNPAYIYLKGKGKIVLDNNEIDISHFTGGIGITSFDIAKIQTININASKIITIENLTTFYNFSDSDFFVIYLGGFHNTLRRNFISKVFNDNPDKIFYHFGDIDAGGFYILEHLKAKTGIKFEPLFMDIETLNHYKKYCKPLSANDVRRLKRLQNTVHGETVTYMLKNNCKLEQEIVGAL